MPAFRPIPARQAVELLDKAGIPNAKLLLVDSAAAGLIKAYAQAILTVDTRGGREVVRDGTVPVELWQRIVKEGASEDVWPGGTVRLAGSGLIGGAPEAQVTDVAFGEKLLRRLVDRHGGSVPAVERPKGQTPTAVQIEAPVDRGGGSPSPSRRARPEGAAIPPGAITATVKQTVEATGLGRTTIDKLMREGRLERRKVDGRTLITVASIRALVATGAASTGS